jgi:hypothetical protein
MEFRDRLRDSCTLMRVAMLFLVLAVLALRFLHPNAYLSEDAGDAVKGFLIGIAIACNLMAVRRNRCRGV